MPGVFSENCKVTVSEDSMTATLYLDPPSGGIAYAVDDLVDFVKNKGIYGGIIYSALEEMTQNNIYNEDYVIARGVLPTEGSNGYFDIFFDNEAKKNPTIRSDGSVDYQSMSEIHNVSAGEKLIQYNKAIPGTHGMDVRGRVLRCKPWKDLPIIKGKGFEYDSDTGIYSAAVDGKIEYDGRTLKITDVYEYRGDLDLVVGKIDFRGDVVIKGNVLSGTFIRATKSITIEGNVEAATLIAGGNILLKKGMQGGQKARISCGGDIHANFLEFTQVEAKGNVEANIIMNCAISSGKDIIVSGKRGAIVGGKTYAVGSISATMLGNVANHRTIAIVGITKALKDREKLLNTKLKVTNVSVDRTKAEIIKASDPRLSNEKKEVRDAKVSQLTRRLRRDEKLASHIKEELENIEATIQVGKNAKIAISGTAYAGVQVIVDDLTLEIEKDYLNSTFSRDENGEKVKVKSNK